jgi:uncharacterized membrane protein YebE (DUF533 family)
MHPITKIGGISALAGLLALSALPAAAQGTYDPGIQDRQFRQEQRVRHGIRSGQLTPGEAAHLEHQQCRIRAAEDAMKADGHLTREERTRLTRMQNHADRDITRLKHNPDNY